MMFTVLALDYDGTIASDGVLDPEVRRAIADIRERGITVAIVTGRILDDLRRAAGDDRPVRPSRRPVRSPAATSRSRVPRSCAESVPRGWICPQRSHEADHVLLMLGMVAGGTGIALVSASARQVEQTGVTT
jgi:DNA-binding transcriptional LysR family regulator